MDLLQLRYFQTVARLEHMTHAARELAIAQPSLSQTIARLEEELGAPLFDRQGRQIRLNQPGRLFLQHVERVFSELEQGKREIADLTGLERGHVALAVIGSYLLPDLLKAFLSLYPHISFRLFQQHSTLTVLHQLENSNIDLCITSPPIQQPGIGWVSLITEEIFLVVPPHHRLAGAGSIRLGEVAHETFVGLKPGNSMRDITDDFCRRAGFTPNVAFEGDEPEVVRGLVGAGLGIAFWPALAWRNPSVSGVVRLHVTEPVCQRTIGLAWLQGRYLSLAARRFREFVIDYFASLTQ
ncbi:MAG: LysR family transcriptional regulator [Ktedonobacteraceae bacterium]|nr:LysR family transcriptional regulator [Ktedonobacteraceae bacterium]